MANRYVLGADIRVTGNYKSQLNTFLNSIKRCEREFDSFTQKVVKDTKAIETSLNQMTKNVSQYANKISKNEKDAVTKSNALQEKMSKSVDKLVAKNFLSIHADKEDRRVIHLKVENLAGEVIKEALEAQRKYVDTIYNGISKEEEEVLKEIVNKMLSNIKKEL